MSDTRQNKPFVMQVKAGTYAWCSCGQSNNQPYCDGSHRGTGKSPVVAKIEEEKTVAWCGCKQTCTPPYCDGTHSKL